ncbi:MAG TPA: 1,4-dihydroxy-2-naphthoate polyprenyltransferase [Microbacteriaceae bacterium]|nr:1,4-dihydroxy-2-naphthoate polyprenyltransferase [Microbacteriaceae bacterium]
MTTVRKPAAKRPASRTPHPRAQQRTVRPAARRAGARDWIAGARLRTLPLAIAPVALGTGVGVFDGGTMPWRPLNAALALIVALALQVGVNFANDYSDGVRGTDAHRVGPQRLTGAGLASPRRVLTVALVFFALAAAAGLALVAVTGQWWMLAIGAFALLAAWFYTGGRRPYGYAGFGELAVFIFFGLVATVGSAFVQSDVLWSDLAWLGGGAIGLYACAVLMANNLRDREQDARVGKRTLSVRLGALGSKLFFAGCMLLPSVASVVFWAVVPAAGFGLFVLLAALPAIAIVATAKTARELILALQLASASALIFGLATGAVFAIAVRG